MEAIESLRGASLFAFGINCSAPRHVEGALRKISRKTNVRGGSAGQQEHLYIFLSCPTACKAIQSLFGDL